VHAVRDQLSPRVRDIRDDDLHALLRARRHLGDAGAHDDGARRTGGRELHESQGVVDLVVVVGVKANLLT
jgi:hypothetical protein